MPTRIGRAGTLARKARLPVPTKMSVVVLGNLRRREGPAPVTNVELHFDLAYVFAVTQLRTSSSVTDRGRQLRVVHR